MMGLNMNKPGEASSNVEYSHPPILVVKDLGVSFTSDGKEVHAVDGVSFQVRPGQTLGIAGESGCGKSVTALSIMQLLPRPVSRISRGQILFNSQNLVDLPIEAMHRVRGKKISMIFQEPMTALNPVHTIGRQMIEVYDLHFPGLSQDQKRDQSIAMLEKVGISDPGLVMEKYPHQLSGGMRQRIMIAMALACEPDILIADEPTTALDVTVQAQIMELIRKLKRQSHMAVILITHDLGVISENCDDVVVMYAGRVAEIAPSHRIFTDPLHPYTQGLLASIPSRAQHAKTRLPTIAGMVPSLNHMPGGCRFAGRCPHVLGRCSQKTPKLGLAGQDRLAACHLIQFDKKNQTF